MTTAKAHRMSTKRLLRILDETRASNRQALETICCPKRASQVPTERFLRIFRDCHVDDKNKVWTILKEREDLSPHQLDGIELYCRGFGGSIQTISQQAHTLAVTIRKSARPVAA